MSSIWRDFNGFRFIPRCLNGFKSILQDYEEFWGISMDFKGFQGTSRYFRHSHIIGLWSEISMLHFWARYEKNKWSTCNIIVPQIISARFVHCVRARCTVVYDRVNLKSNNYESREFCKLYIYAGCCRTLAGPIVRIIEMGFAMSGGVFRLTYTVASTRCMGVCLLSWLIFLFGNSWSSCVKHFSF